MPTLTLSREQFVVLDDAVHAHLRTPKIVHDQEILFVLRLKVRKALGAKQARVSTAWPTGPPM